MIAIMDDRIMEMIVELNSYYTILLLYYISLL